MLKDLKLKAYNANMRLEQSKLAPLTFGNASCIDRNAGIIAIKPSGVAYSDLSPDDMVIVDLDTGKAHEGQFNPSSDTKTHLVLYQNFESIGAIVHTHSMYACSFAQSGVNVPCLGTTHADFFEGSIPITRPLTSKEVSLDYEAETGNVIVSHFQNLDPMHHPGVLVSQHGPFSWGVDGNKAIDHAIIMEYLCKMAYKTMSLNSSITPIPEYLRKKHFHRKHGDNAYYGQRQQKNSESTI